MNGLLIAIAAMYGGYAVAKGKEKKVKGIWTTDISQFASNQIGKGIQVEMASTNDPRVAFERTLNNLNIDPSFYSQLIKHAEVEVSNLVDSDDMGPGNTTSAMA